MDTEELAIGQHAPASISGWPKPGCIDELGRLAWIPVATELEAQRWDALMDAEHFLGAGPLVGRRLRYLVRSSRYGDIAALAFSAAAWRLQPRDAFIGWSAEQREAQRQRVVCNSRFLIRSASQVPGLASHLLATTLRRLPQDWAARYGEAPVLVETFVDRARHRGGCYRASNWCYVGDTQGRGRNDTAGERPRSPKAIYLYALRRDWRRRLGGSEPPDAAERPVDDWVRHEFAHARCGDRRLHERLIHITRDFAAHSEAAGPEACGTRTRTKAAYRFLANSKASMQELIRSHAQASAGRCRHHDVVLAVQDTTTLNYAAPTITEGLGPIGSSADGAQGLIVHDTMAFSTEGTPLGLIDVQAWAREADDHGLRRLGSDDRDLDNKESGKWLDSHYAASRLQQQLPGTRVVSVGDRESDIYELLVAARAGEAADALVRARQDRRLADRTAKLNEHLAARAPDAEVELNVPPRHNQPGRIARLAVRYERVTLKPPQNKRRLGPVELDVVQAAEIEPPQGSAGLKWTLLTTVPTPTAEAACERLQWYATRWQIEVYHRTLKSGCRIEERHLGDANRLETALAIDMVIAWRTFWLTKWGRERPDTPASACLEPDEWKALLVLTNVSWDPSPADEPTLHQAMHLIAGLGGYQDRKREPGAQTIWRGLQRLEDIAQVYQRVHAAALGEQRPP